MIKTEKGLVVIVGCSHPGVKNILKVASKFGDPKVIIGGLHGFRDFDLIRGLELCGRSFVAPLPFRLYNTGYAAHFGYNAILWYIRNQVRI